MQKAFLELTDGTSEESEALQPVDLPRYGQQTSYVSSVIVEIADAELLFKLAVSSEMTCVGMFNASSYRQ